MTDLVLQAPAISAAELAAIAELAQAQDITPLPRTPAPRTPPLSALQAYRLLRVAAHEDIAEICAKAGIDHAYVPADLALARVCLVVIDMDSTLITIECIDEVADLVGLKPEVGAITAAAMRGEIDFRESIVRRVALVAGLPISALQRVYDERLRPSPGAERMLAGFKAVGARTLLVSGGFTFFTDRLQARFGLDETASNTLEIADGRLTGRLRGPIVDAQEKAARLLALRQRACREGRIAVAIGDGANDVPMLKAADISVAYHAKPLVRATATYAIDHCGLDAVLNLFA